MPHAWPVAVFALTWVLMAAPRLRLLPIGRAGGALLGAVLMVLGGTLSPAEAYASIDGDTLALLLGMMLLNAGFARSGLLDRAAAALGRAFPAPRALLVAVSVTAALTSAFLVNDTVCLLMTPVVVQVCLRAGLPLGPYLLVLATSANLGSAMTLVGNPQNMLIGSLSQLAFGDFFLRMLPVAALALAAHIAFSLFYFRRALPRAPGPAAPSGPAAPGPAADAAGATTTLLVFAGVLTAFFAGVHLGFAALGGGVLLLVLRREDPADTFRRVDWELLVFFAGLFIVARGLSAGGLVASTWSALAPALRLDDASGVATFTAAMTVGSNVVSNVPLVVLAGPFVPELGAGATGWLLLAWVTTLAGNLTLVGSVANLIVAEQARAHHTLGFMEYLRFGAVSAMLSLALGVPALLLLG
jgi:Na+/H+ antiporter NhaD/arsenite permease-like protein